MATTATPDGNAHVRIDGTKTWISNGGIADHYVVFARTGEAPGAKGLSAFMVDADTPGLTVAERIEVIAPHPLATLRSTPAAFRSTNRLGAPGEGFKVAMATLDIFRSTVGAAALGFARRALHETVERAATPQPVRRAARRPAADAGRASPTAPPRSMPRRCWSIARPGPRTRARRASPAKPRWPRCSRPKPRSSVIDRAVQMLGGRGVTKGVKVEELYREIRALRIYEGATEVQKIVIARELLKNRAAEAATMPARS